MLSHDINIQSLQITMKSGQLDDWELAKRDPVLAVRSMIHLKPWRCAQPRPNKHPGIKRKNNYMRISCRAITDISGVCLTLAYHKSYQGIERCPHLDTTEIHRVAHRNTEMLDSSRLCGAKNDLLSQKGAWHPKIRHPKFCQEIVITAPGH